MPKESRYDIRQGEVSYLKELLGHPGSIMGACASAGLACLLLIGFGPMAALVPVIGAVAGGTLAGLFVPDSPIFREYVNRRKRKERREDDRSRLWNEIQQRLNPNDEWGSPHIDRYNRMMDRATSFYQMASSGSNHVSHYDAEKIDDLTVDYLRLWLATLIMEERERSVNVRDIRERLHRINDTIDHADVVEQKKLEDARRGLKQILDRRDKFGVRKETAEARMLSMADGMEEIYSRILANPSDVGNFLDEQIDKLQVEEEIDLAVDREIALLTKKVGETKKEDARMQLLIGGKD